MFAQSIFGSNFLNLPESLTKYFIKYKNYLNFFYTRCKPSPIRLLLSILFTHSKLNGEKINRSQFLYLLIWCSQWYQADFLRKFLNKIKKIQQYPYQQTWGYDRQFNAQCQVKAYKKELHDVSSIVCSETP